MKALRYLLLVSLLFVVGCRDHKETVPDEISEILGLKIDRPLEVSFASPQGSTMGPKDYEAITVVFNQPMKALSADEGPIKTPFKISPEVKGRFRWKGTATVSFEPEEALAFGSTYKIVVPAGIKSPGGNALKADYAFEFNTPGPSVVTTFPDNGYRWQKSGSPIFFQFDQGVEPGAVEKHLSLTTAKDSAPVSARAVEPAELEKLNKDRSDDSKLSAEELVAIVPSELKPGVTYSIKLAKGIKGRGGPIASESEHLMTFTTLDDFKWAGKKQDGKDRPERSIPFRFTSRVNAKALKENLKVVPKLEIPISDYDESDDWNYHSLYLAMEPNTRYTFTISGELKDTEGRKLGSDVSLVWETGDRGPLVQVPEGLGVLESQGPLTIPMGLRNIDKLTYRMARLDREQVLQLLRSEDREWLWGRKSYSPPGGYQVNKTLKPQGPKNELYTYDLELKQALKGKKTGFVYFQVELEKGETSFNRRGLVQVSDLGLTGKFSPENSVFLISSLDQAKPLADVEATLLDSRGRALWRGKSGSDGTVKAPGWTELLASAKDGTSAPTLYLFCKRGEDEAYIANGGFGEIYSWQFDVPYRWSTSAHYLRSKVYSERGLYKPGEEVHLKGSLRDRESGDWILPQVSELKFVVKDSRDKKLEDGTVSVNEFGTFHHSLTLPPKSPTGSYRVDYSIDKAKANEWDVSERVAGVSFRVEEFEAAQFEVNVSSEQKAAVMGDKLDFQVEGKWLFGAPMIDNLVDWGVRVEPARYVSKDHPGFDFGPSFDGDEDTDDSKVIKVSQGTTDQSGLVKAQVELAGIPYKGDADLVVEASIKAANRRQISGRTSIPLARGEFRIGLKPQSRFLPADKPVDVQLITLSAAGETVSGKNVKVELINRKWNSVRKTDVDGRFRWVVDVEDKTLETQDLKSDGKAKSFSVNPKESGYYIVRATATDEKKNEIVSESSFYAHGGGYSPWARSDDDKLELVTDKNRYAPGETAKILVKNPWDGEVTAFISYERDLILHSYVTKLEGAAPVIEVPLTDKHLPNLYVSVMLFRGRLTVDSDGPDDAGKPAFKIGYADLQVAPDSKRLKVEISTEKERYGPNDEVTANLKVTDSQGNPVRAELSLAAADVGVLNLINFQTPDLFDTYYGSLPLAVKTSENRLDVIGQRSYGTKGEDQGGGGGYTQEFRKNFKSTAVWEPEVVTDSKGEAKVTFKLPENLTTFRLMATAITADTRCGSSEKEIINTKKLILKPSGPAFVRIGDEFEAGVLAVNGSEKGQSVTVTPEFEGLVSKDAAPRDVYLKAGEEREILFKYKAEAEGQATLRFAGKMDSADDGVQFEFPVQLAVQRVNLAHSGYLDEGELKQGLDLPQTALSGAEVKVSLASSLLLGLDSSVKELLDYPYGCLEQRLSRLTPLLHAEELVERLELKAWNSEKVKVAVQKNLDLFSGYTHSSGGLKVWPDSKKVHPFLTARAVSVAHLAKKNGYKLKGQWVDKARSYLKNYLDGKAPKGYQLSDSEDLVCRAAALEALTRWGFSGQSYLNKLMDKRDKMPVAGRAYLLQVAHRLDQKKSVEQLAQELKNSLKIENQTAYFDVDESKLPWLFSSDTRDTGLALNALLEAEQELPMSDKVVRWLLEARNSEGTWGTTSNNSAVLQALVNYSKKVESQDSSLSVTVSLDGKSIGEASLSKDEPQNQVVQALEPGSKKELKLEKSGDGRLYYNVALSYEDTKPSPAKDEGLTVLRSVTDLNDKLVGELKGGEIYKVHLSIVAPDLRRYVVLEDPIPAGLSVVKTDFATESQSLSSLLERGNQPSWQTFHRFEDYSDKVLLFADALAPGEHSYQYLVRAQTPGDYLYPAAQVEEMYHPEVFGRTATRKLVVK